MSDLGAAAQAMGVPEPLVERSARAWAADSGQSYEAVVAAWAGGESVATASPAPSEAPPEEAAPEAADQPEAAPSPAPAATPAAPAAAAPPAAAAASVAPAPDDRPPVLQAPPDRPLVTVLGGVGVVMLTLLLGFVFPSLPVAGDQVRSSQVPLSEAAITGRDVYQQAGCASCHTQLVRAVVADVGLGPVSLADSNQVLGFRRIGPDLSDVGARHGPDQIDAVVSGSSHPALALSSSSMDALVAYLSESSTSTGSPSGGEEGES